MMFERMSVLCVTYHGEADKSSRCEVKNKVAQTSPKPKLAPSRTTDNVGKFILRGSEKFVASQR